MLLCITVKLRREKVRETNYEKRPTPARIAYDRNWRVAFRRLERLVIPAFFPSLATQHSTSFKSVLAHLLGPLNNIE